ncbi:MAG: hypothetical protein V7K24_10995 [Nostoc sp.]
MLVKLISSLKHNADHWSANRQGLKAFQVKCVTVRSLPPQASPDPIQARKALAMPAEGGRVRDGNENTAGIADLLCVF